MAVIVKEMVDFGAGPKEIRVFLPRGIITKEQRERAEKLDQFLAETLPKVAEDLKAAGLLEAEEFRKWHALGQRLSFIDDTSLVSPEDVQKGYIWRAIRDHAPPELIPMTSRPNRSPTEERRRGGRLDHFQNCYHLGKYAWEKVSWLRLMSNWDSLYETPGVFRDETQRVVHSLCDALQDQSALSRDDFRAILKELRRTFSTKEAYVHPDILSDEFIQSAVNRAVSKVLSTIPATGAAP